MTISELLGTTVLSVIGTTGIGLGTIKWLGSKWVDDKLLRGMEAFKHENQKQIEAIRNEAQRDAQAVAREHALQIERLKFERADLLDRAAKLNQREFEIIPDLWAKVTEAHLSLNSLISPYQVNPDVSRMGESQFKEFVEQARIPDWQKAELSSIKNGADRSEYYVRITKWVRLNDANQAAVDFNLSLKRSSIFLHPDTFTRLREFFTPLWSAFAAYKTGIQMGDEFGHFAKEDSAVTQYLNTGDARYNDLSQFLRERYWINAGGEAV